MMQIIKMRIIKTKREKKIIKIIKIMIVKKKAKKENQAIKKVKGKKLIN